MQTFQGMLAATESRDLPLRVSFQVDEGRVRIWSDRHRIGSWQANEVHVRRQSIFRFLISIEEDVYAFTPEDPSGFASAVEVEIDLTANPSPRFGLADRLRQAAETG